MPERRGVVTVTDAELVRRARDWGYSITGRQLERWRNDGIVPPLSARGRGRGRGQSRFYTTDPSEQLRELLRLRDAQVPLAECAVRLWLTGFDITLDALRQHLPRALKSVARFRKLLRSPNFATRFAEYLTRRPQARKSVFGDRSWNRKRYDEAIHLAQGWATTPESLPEEARRDFYSVTARMPTLNEDERAFLISLGGAPDTMMADVVPLLDRIFEKIADASDEELIRARNIQCTLLSLSDVSEQIAGLMPNVVSALIARFENDHELRSSYGLFAAIGMATLAEKENIDILSSLEERLAEFQALLERLRAATPNARTA